MNMTSGKVLICILSRNAVALTRRCINSALRQNYEPGYDLLVVDNASTDSTPQYLSSIAADTFRSVMLSEQLSVAACWNYALDWAFSPLNPNQYAGVLMLNNDMEIRPDTVDWLMNDRASFVTAISVRTESELNPPYWTSPTSRRPHPDFSCFMIKPECWKRVGRFDERFAGAYCEDSDYHVRAHRAGVELICIDLPFLHHGCGTLKNSDAAEKRRIERQAERNRELFEEMYGCRPGTKEYNELFTIAEDPPSALREDVGFEVGEREGKERQEG